MQIRIYALASNYKGAQIPFRPPNQIMFKFLFEVYFIESLLDIQKWKFTFKFIHFDVKSHFANFGYESKVRRFLPSFDHSSVKSEIKIVILYKCQLLFVAWLHIANSNFLQVQLNIFSRFARKLYKFEPWVSTFRSIDRSTNIELKPYISLCDTSIHLSMHACIHPSILYGISFCSSVNNRCNQMEFYVRWCIQCHMEWCILWTCSCNKIATN